MRPYEAFFELLQAFPPCDGAVELRAVTPGRGRATRGFFKPTDTRGMTAWLSRRGRYLHAFFGVAFRDGRGGTKRHLTALPALWVDIDRPPTGLPPAEPQPSAIVASGRGEHWYWILSSPLRVDTPSGQAAAESLLRGLAQRVAGDPGSTDVSHLLRVPGTLNPKYAPPVRVEVRRLESQRRYHPADLFAYAAPLDPPRPMRDLDQGVGSPVPPPHGALVTMLAECGFLRWAARAPAEVPEPLWYAALTNVAMFPGADTAAHALSSGHPMYSSGETQAKLAHAQRFGRPHTCRTIAALGATQCAGCPWAGRVRAPSGIPYKLRRPTARGVGVSNTRAARV